MRGTRAEDIARAARIAPRTFYRYFATKEESVAPFFAWRVEQWVDAARTAPAELPLADALAYAACTALAPYGPRNAESLEWVRTLLRLADDDPA